jgi:hypothetical protein
MAASCRVLASIGQALMERVVFDENGQLLTGSFTDYALPRASDAVSFDIGRHPLPAKTIRNTSSFAIGPSTIRTSRRRQ